MSSSLDHVTVADCDRFMVAQSGHLPENDVRVRPEVLQDLAASRIKVTEAATLMSGRRQVFRLAKAFARHGPEALVSRRRGRPTNRSYPSACRTEVLGIVRERYCDFGPTLAAAKLAELHGIHLGRETLRHG
jgi:hypothetical protein